MRNPKPITAKAQLRAYHARQGLQGQAHRHAVRADMKLVRQNCTPEDFDQCHRDGMGMDAMFVFSLAPQGAEYWRKRCRGNWS